MRQDNRFESIDKAALRRALLNLGVCPRCRADLIHDKDHWNHCPFCDKSFESQST